MRRGNLIVLLVAIVMAVTAALMARSWLQRQSGAAGPAPTPTGTIVVAAGQLGFGTVLGKDNVMEVAWTGPRISAAYASKDELLKDGRRVVLTPLEKGEPIFRPKVTGAGGRASLSSLVAEGMRAVAVRVDDVRGVAGFVLPADHVDVLLIREERHPNGVTENYSDVLLQHVKVLAVDQLSNEREEKPTVAKAVTLEVTPEQAQKLMLAEKIGKLSLILREAGDGDAARTKRITEADLGLQQIPGRPAATAQAPRASSTSSVQIVRGTTNERVEVPRVAE
jgi:pilus assembly protein CpaB